MRTSIQASRAQGAGAALQEAEAAAAFAEGTAALRLSQLRQEGDEIGALRTLRDAQRAEMALLQHSVAATAAAEEAEARTATDNEARLNALSTKHEALRLEHHIASKANAGEQAWLQNQCEAR